MDNQLSETYEEKNRLRQILRYQNETIEHIIDSILTYFKRSPKFPKT